MTPKVYPMIFCMCESCFKKLPNVPVLGVYRVEHNKLTRMYNAVREAMEPELRLELDLWHGTSGECIRNIILTGFNRTYGGRHGTKLGHGTYFSTAAHYSVRFCDRRRGATRMMFLARVLVGAWTAGSPDLVEPPHRDLERTIRYDSTVDSVDSPTMFCIFRDYQAVPCYLVEFESSGS